MQPAYLPWAGYFHRIAVSDVHVVLDHVQLGKKSFTNRNKIRIASGSTWLTVPVRSAGRSGNLEINRLEIANESRWAEKHWRSLCVNYARAPYFAEHKEHIAAILQRPFHLLCELARELTGYLLRQFGITTPLLYSSQMGSAARKDELVLELCRKAGATTYLSGPLGRDYLREDLFRDAGINLIYHDYRPPQYSQAYPGFEANMSAIDLLFNHGPRSYDIMCSGQDATK